MDILSSRWNHLKVILEQNGPFAYSDFTPSAEFLDFLLNDCRILVIGAGGLGCELLKDLAFSGFLNIDVIDMDTIDISNLNRQFLYRHKDVGRSKAEVAAKFINNRIKGAKVVPHFCKIQDYDSSFYQDFHIVVCGVDSISARRWINGMLISLLEYNDDGTVDQTSVIPLVDGGTEGFKGSVKVVLPGISACIDCTLDLYPPQVTFPLCTIAHTPRQPEHCIEYVKLFKWVKDKPFENQPIDGDNPEHILWIMNAAIERANEYDIQGVTYRLTQGVVKHIIPAVASTNAVIAAACATEVFKIVTNCCSALNNFMVFNDVNGVYTYKFEAFKSEDCVSCSQRPQKLSFQSDACLRDVIEYLKTEPTLLMEKPGLTTSVNGKTKTLYMTSIKSLEKATSANLSKKLSELELVDGQHITIVDVTTPKSMNFVLYFTDDDMKH